MQVGGETLARAGEAAQCSEDRVARGREVGNEGSCYTIGYIAIEKLMQGGENVCFYAGRVSEKPHSGDEDVEDRPHRVGTRQHSEPGVQQLFLNFLSPL